ncbi:hypothetical protein [Acinetobacter pragensis]|uniref:Uncharacterized protein n=1 Tax=Acinetobacter pragensis TaxID=1806892 RepID=A0A151Y3A6_9GAMM|nr:hypothetical protein [Acinetobacter pragensis]KYQ72496.1 hypothetical protein AZH43_09990 [Acinetobacter pragensis]
MYFWNVNKLVEDLRLNKVSEVDFKNYYIASTIIIFFSYLALTLTPESSASEAWASFILQVGLLMSWMNAIFKVNGGEKGRDFLKRIIALYLPITLQSFALFIVIGVVLNVILPFFSSNLDEAAFKQFNIIKDLIFEVILSTYIYWRIYKAVKQINHPK